MSNLYRVFHEGVKGVRKLYPMDETYISNALELINKKPNSDFYESIYLYEEKHKEILKQKKSLAGIKDIKIDRLVFDFDSKNVEEAFADAKILVERLQSIAVPENAIRIFYSANKGAHVEVHLNEVLQRSEFENIIQNIAGDLLTFDHRIKDEQRLFRFPLTKHNKSGLFKIPLTIAELENLSLEEIKNKAKDINPEDFYMLLDSYTIINLPKGMQEVKDTPTKKIEATVIPSVESGDRPDLSKKPKHLTAAKYVLQQGFFEEGERNEACMILASTYKYLNEGIDHTYNIIKATLRLRARRLGLPNVSETDKQELWRTIIQPIFSPTWKGGTFSEEDGLLKRTIDRYDLDKLDITDAGLVNLAAVANQFRDFAVNIEANTIKLGIDEIDKKLRITTSMLVAFLAAPSAGKSSVSFGILNTVSKTGEKSIFFSMDMSIPQVYQRLIQRHTGHSGDTILKNYENNRVAEIENYQNILNLEYPNVKFSFKSGLTVEQIRGAIIQEQMMTGVLPRLVIIDYLECISSGGIADSAQSKAAISTALKGVANELGICIILLTQPRMAAGGPAGELNSYTDIKGSSVISEAAATVITMSRPGFSPKHPEDDNYVTLNVVKNRMGTLSSTDLHWDGLTGNIRSLSGEEENDLKALRLAIAAEKAKNSDGDLY